MTTSRKSRSGSFRYKDTPESPARDGARGQPITIERVERALMTVAYIVARHGPVYAPIFERLERELAELRAKGDPVERAKLYLAATRSA